MQSFEGSAYGTLDHFELVDRDIPEPGARQVRIRVAAAALGFVDGLIIQGRYQYKPPLPYVPGGEIAGVVDAVGAEVHHLSAGDRVATWQFGGGLAEYTLAPADEVEPIPANLAFADAAAILLDYQTAQYALFGRGGVRAGETVLVAGAAGGVGAAAVQLAAKAGAYVIAAASTPEKRDRVRALGAQAAINSAGPDIRAEIKAAAPRGVVDVVVDPVGGPTFEALFRSLAKEGRHLVIGFAAGSIPALPANLALLKSAALIGVEIRHFLASRPAEARAARAALFEQVASGALAPPPLIPFPLVQAREALATASCRDKTGKVVVIQQPDALASDASRNS
ncbi:NADPH:quinone oxidoreductase family protein [Methylobacterium nodulans]|uniref:Alcohol dehydrogenase zinc-binding domain protein n=1 Tax=Methylobacterium nodulans (strain LMG 21967 / CNCM I-2342 / ORS 2060) TaxID=460265 RepID=B8IC04_METNO|nr:NADPH:quinone oxidoreductase family protein [Methylobacterium nodulans]ACL61186.1 Alcohol dehydrogenase zinc-binding domain protein [Methylobacterium nodulans ORS 2060]